MTEAMTWQEQFGARIMKSAPVPYAELVRGQGCVVWGSDGTRYLDFLAGIAVNALGHAHPAFVEAVSAQAATLAHASNYFATPPQLELAARLLRISGGDRVYFGNSGAEAMEAAIKLARRTGRRRILALDASFHGRTMGALSLTGKPALREPFEPLLPGVEHLETTVAALEAALDDDVAALVVEPIKGEAGVIDLPEGYLEAARHLTREHGALLILDEIQTGAGRTGTWFAFQQHDIVPDAVAFAKGVGGGVPIGGLIAFGAAADLLTVGQHGSTFGGNALATAAANAVLAEIERSDLMANAVRRGEQLRSALRTMPGVTEVRGRGLLLGVGLERPVAQDVFRAGLERGLIVNAPNEFTVRLAPPLIVGDDEIAEFLTLFPLALEAAS